MVYCRKCFNVMGKNGFDRNDTQRYKCKNLDCGVETIYPLSEDEMSNIDLDDFDFDIDNIGDDELITQNIKIAKRLQRSADISRIERKSFRDYARVENAIGEYTKELNTLLKEKSLSKLTKKHRVPKTSSAGIIHFTDVHFNELVNLIEEDGNQYDFNVASKRIKLFVSTAKTYFDIFNVKNILVALTGDLMNSDRRVDELLSMATNRSKATFLAVDILQQALLDLNKNYNLTVANVTGNEGRIRKDHELGELIASDNYDWTIFNILKLLFKDSKGVNFVGGAAREVVVNVNGQNVLLTHGEQLAGQTEKKVQHLIGKYTAKGVNIHFTIFGHMHSAMISDIFARGSSMVGSNDYSDKKLNLISRASQNIHIVHNIDRRDSIKIDLQNTDDVVGYNIDNSLEAYNPKSSSKLVSETTIIKIVV